MAPAAHALATPLLYETDYEVPEEGETETQAKLLETLQHISETTWKDTHHATRSVHAKSHGLLRGELRISGDLPANYAQGIFAKAGVFPIVIRLSTVPGDILDDNVSTPRGMAIKVVGVEGARLDSSDDDVTQDFILVNCGPAFASPNAKKFLGGLKLAAATTDKAPGLKKALSAVLRGAEKAIEAVGGQSGTLIGLGGHPETHILGNTFYSKAPLLFGPYMAKLAVAPSSPNLTALTDAPVDLHDKPNGLREAVVNFFRNETAEWELQVQLCTDLAKMPIEDASVAWPEDISPYVTVARIVVTPQLAWSEQRSVAVDDKMAFNPWHCIAAHRPIGSIMRIRKAAYEMSARFRAEHNDLSITEPKNLDDFPN